ncbi:MAG: hypothetical protein FAF03_12070 [Epsilonproteobacteria bacterium]|nr:hypothetical protein [Campylobacterota bacterium]
MENEKKVLLTTSIILAALIPSGLSAEVIAEKNNRTVKGNKKDTLEVSMSPGTYKFTLQMSSKKGKKPNPKFKIQQKQVLVVLIKHFLKVSMVREHMKDNLK